MRKTTGTGYPHPNLNQEQREAIDRLSAPPVELVRDWTHVYLIDPPRKGVEEVTFYPRRRRTWTLYVKGYPVVRVYGRVVKD